MIKGNNRRMFRKPGLARQAIGILASSKELMDEVQPVRMMAGGDTALEQARQQVLASGISPTNPLFDQLVGRIYSNTTQSPLAIRGGVSSLSQYLSSPTLLDFLPTRRQPPPEDFRKNLPDIPGPEIMGRAMRGLVQGGGARDESGTGEPRPQRIKPQGTPGGTLGREVDRLSRALNNPIVQADEERYGSDAMSLSAIDLLKTPPRGVEGARGTAEFQEKMSPSDLALDTRRLNTDRAALNRAQRTLTVAQNAYDKTIAGGTEAQQAEALTKLQEARNEVKRLAPIVDDLEETVGTGKRKQTLDRFSGQLDDINRQLADENISDKARQRLLKQRDKVLSQMEEEGFGSRSRYEPPSDPAISFEEAEAREAAIEEQEKKDAPSPKKDAPSPATVADQAASDAETNTGSNLTNPGEKKSAVQLYIETLQGKEKPKRDPRDQKIIEEAMRGAEYNEDEIKKNIKDDAFWNAVMLTGLNMVVGSSERGDRFSNMARSAIAGINTFNADVKEREKTAYKKFIDKQNRNLQKANLILSQEKTEADREFREFTTVMQLKAAEDMNYFKRLSAFQAQQGLDLREQNRLFEQRNKQGDYILGVLGDRKETKAAEDRLRGTKGYEEYAKDKKQKDARGQLKPVEIPRDVLERFLRDEAAKNFPLPSSAGSVIVLDP